MGVAWDSHGHSTSDHYADVISEKHSKGRAKGKAVGEL